MKNKTFKEHLIAFLLSSKMKTLYWTFLNSVIVLLIAYLGDLGYTWTPFAVGFLNMITKYINRKFL